jgi:site-specific DNA recombinase
MNPRPVRVDGYVRVSRVAGREGESFISPEVQRKKIVAWAELHGVEVVQWWEELDQSGRRRDRPMFQEALRRCEAGETDGIVVARLDRFARSAVDALEAIKRLNEAGARLVSVEDNFDGSTPMGRFAIGILTLIAELELERITESWSTAVREAVGRGVHISARVPTGYKREQLENGKSGRLLRDEPAASAVAEVFKRRALGASYTELAAYLDEQMVPPSGGGRYWSTTGVTNLLKNPVYLGQARSGAITNDDAHEPLVTGAEFDAAQGSRTQLAPRDGSLASLALLGGLVRCAGCGHTLKITGNTARKTGERYPVYYCVGRYGKGPCASRATIRASYLDDYVEERVLAALQAEDGLLAQAVQADAELGQAHRELHAAEHELALYIETDLIAVVGQEAFMQGVQTRQQRVDQARERIAALHSQSLIATELTSGSLLDAWPELSTSEKRILLHGLLDRVVLERAPGRGPGQVPVSQRTQIVLRGNVLLQ